MSAVAKLRATKQAPLPLKALNLFEDYPKTRLVAIHTIPVTNGDDRTYTRKQELPFAPDGTDIERVIRVLSDFTDACGDDLLNLDDQKRHEKAREVLGGDLKDIWDKIITAAGNNTSNADFITNARKFLANLLPSNAFLIQQEYMHSATKPFNMTCFTVASRLRLINKMSQYLPGSGGAKLFPMPTSMKNAFYRLMLPQWQLNFDATGNQLDDDAYTFQKLVAFMEQQRLHHDAANGNRRPNDRNRQQAGRRHSPYPSARQSAPSNRPPPPPPRPYQARSAPYHNNRGRYNRPPPPPPPRGNFNRSLPARSPHVTPPRRPPAPHTRSRGPATTPQRSNANRETRNLHAFHGQQDYSDQDGHYNGEQHDDNNAPPEDGFYGDSSNGQDPENNTYGSDSFYAHEDAYDQNYSENTYDADAFHAHEEHHFDPYASHDAYAHDNQHDQYSSYDSYDY